MPAQVVDPCLYENHDEEWEKGARGEEQKLPVLQGYVQAREQESVARIIYWVRLVLAGSYGSV